MAQKVAPVQSTSWPTRLIAGVAALLAIIGCLAVVAYVPVRWAEVHVLDTSNWVKTVGPIPQDPTVSSALGNYVVTQAFTTADVQSRISDALPDKAAFLAGPITTQVTTVATRLATNVVASDRFNTVWVDANRAAHERLVKVARSDARENSGRRAQLSVNIQSAVQQLKERFGATGTLIQPTGQGASLVADTKLKVNQLRTTVKSIDTLNQLLPYLALTCLLGAIALARRRQRLIMILSLTIGVMLLLLLVGVRIGRGEVVGLAQQDQYQPAIGIIYDNVVAPLKSVTYVGLLGSVIIMVLAATAGPYKWAVALRRQLHIADWYQTRAYKGWSGFRGWTAANAVYIWIAALVIILVVMAFWLTPTWVTLLQAALVWVMLVAVESLIARPARP